MNTTTGATVTSGRKGHRPRAGRLLFGPRIRIALQHGLVKTTTQMLCDICEQPVRVGTTRNVWVHGEEPGERV